MTISTYKMGPGTLKLGAGGSQDVSAQIRSAAVVWSESVTATDAIPVLSGEELAPEETASQSATLSVKLLQDLDASGVVAYSWANRGEEVAFEFIPNTAAARKVTGTVRVVPITLGGDVKTRPESDFTWSCVGYPELGAVV